MNPGKIRKNHKIIRNILMGSGVLILMIFSYLFLLLGEPDEDAKYIDAAEPVSISQPINALETQGSNLQAIADAFGQPLMVIYGNSNVTHAQVQDVAFRGSYARLAVITYTLNSGEKIDLESIAPLDAIELIDKKNAVLDGNRLYSVCGFNAARMDDDSEMNIIAQSNSAIYRIHGSKSCETEIESLLNQTYLLENQNGAL